MWFQICYFPFQDFFTVPLVYSASCYFSPYPSSSHSIPSTTRDALNSLLATCMPLNVLLLLSRVLDLSLFISSMNFYLYLFPVLYQTWFFFTRDGIDSGNQEWGLRGIMTQFDFLLFPTQWDMTSGFILLLENEKLW